jgi:hypothetical protein
VQAGRQAQQAVLGHQRNQQTFKLVRMRGVHVKCQVDLLQQVGTTSQCLLC